MRHIDDSGRPLWFRYFGLGIGWRLFRGTEELSPHLMGLIEMWDMNRRGDALWNGWTLEDGSFVEDFYLNKSNVTKPALGSNRSVLGAALNEQDDVLFAGKGDNTDGVWHLFLNDRNLTEGWLSGHTGMKAKGLSDDGHLLWHLYRDGAWRLMLDSTDISTPVFGDHKYSVIGGMEYISRSGVVAWLGHDDTLGRSVAFRNQEDISTPVVGTPGGAARILGMDDWGDILWEGMGVLTDNKRNVFVNSFNLTRDAMPDGDYRSAYALAIGPNGHVLWYSSHSPRNSTIWLSTPVPEPSALLLGVPLVFLLRRRKQAIT